MSDTKKKTSLLERSSMVMSSIEKMRSIEKKEKSKRIYITVMIMLSYICLGCYKSIAGPTLYILKKGVNVKTESIAVIFTTRSIGSICGYILGGAAFDSMDVVLKKKVVIVMFQILCALTAFAIPFCQALGSLSAVFFAAGLCTSALDTGFNTYMLQMWGKKSNPYFLVLHFIYGLGGLIGPILARIFVEDVSAASATSNTTHTITVNDLGTANFPKLLYAYIALCAMTLFMAVLWFFSLCCPNDEIHMGSIKMKGTLKVPTMEFTLFAVITTCFLIFFTGCIDGGYQHMLATYGLEGYHLTTANTVNLAAIFWGFYTIGGLLAIFCAIKFHPFFMILICLILEAVAGIILITLSKKENDFLAFGNAVLGLGAAAICGWTILWLDRYIITTYKIMSALFVMESLAEMIVPQALAITLQKDTNSLSYFVMSVPVLYLAILIFQCLWFFPHGEKFISLSQLPKRKRRVRICPIFLERARKGSEEPEEEDEDFEEDEEESSAEDEKIPKAAVMVTKKENESQTDVHFMSDLIFPEAKKSESEVQAKPSGSAKSNSPSVQELEEAGAEKSAQKEESEKQTSEAEENAAPAPISSESKKDSNLKDQPKEDSNSLPEKPRRKSWNFFNLG